MEVHRPLNYIPDGIDKNDCQLLPPEGGGF
jgi:hypothetical protein